MTRHKSTFAFGPYKLIPSRQLLLRDRSQVKLGGRAFDVLQLLVTRAGELVTKEALVDFAWPRTSVSESSLRVQIRKLRRVLGDASGQPSYIASVARRGYRFVAEVLVEPDGEGGDTAAAAGAGFHTLPALRAIFGRVEEVKAVVRAVGDGGLVTVVGPAGVGKTTVAVAAARALRANFSQDACFLDLSGLTSGSLVAHLLANALGIHGRPAAIMSAIVADLRERRILVVLDNCEHVLPAVAALAAAILEVGASARLLATSRAPLGLRSEIVQRMAPLAFPQTSQVTGMQEALSFPAVSFFGSRAFESSGREFEDKDVSAVVALCEALDGLPLALELAAAKLRTMKLADVLASVGRRFDLLRSDREWARQGTLWRALDWSYQLLSGQEMGLLRVLAVFAGGFELPDVVALAKLTGLDALESTAALGELVGKSLVVAEAEAGGEGVTLRYRLLQSVRDLAGARLAEDAVMQSEARLRHAHLTLARFRRSEREWDWAEAEAIRSRYESRVGDLREALDWCFGEGGRTSLGMDLCAAAIRLWNEQSSIFEQMHQVGRALEHGASVPDSAPLRTKLAVSRAWSMTLARQLGPDTERAWQTAIGLAEESGDPVLKISAVSSSAIYLIYTGRHHEAVGRLNSCIADATHRGDAASLIDAERRRTLAEMHLGHFVRVRARLEDLAKQLARGMPPSRIARYRGERYVSIHSSLAFLHLLMGQPDRAAWMAEDMVARTGLNQQVMGQSNVLSLVALPIALWRGDLDALGRATTRLRRNVASKNIAIWEPVCRFYEAAGEHACGRADAIDDMEAAIADLERDRFLVRTPLYLGIVAEAALARRPLDQAGRIIDRALKHAQELGEAWCLAELMRIKGVVIARSGDPDGARDWLGKARTAASDLGARFFELRIANDIVCLPQSPERRAEAVTALASIYETFEEGHGIPDLVRAAALCQPLANSDVC